MALIFYLSSHPAPELSGTLPIFLRLKLIHIIEYGILSFILFFAVRETTPLKRSEAAAFAVVAVLLYGATDELHQVFVPMRSASLVDVFANCVGAALAQLGIFFSWKYGVGRLEGKQVVA